MQRALERRCKVFGSPRSDDQARPATCDWCATEAHSIRCGVARPSVTIAVVSWSLGSVLSQRRFPLAPGAMGFASEMICGSVMLLLLSAAVGERPEWPPQAQATWSWVYLIVFGSLLAFNAYMVLLSRVSAALASSYTFVNPVIAMALGIWLGGETVTAFEWAAAGVISVGVILLVLGRQPVKASH